jgi:hypothetical protein
MNAMGHGVPTMMGVDQQDLAERLRRLVPGYMAMGGSGMSEMADMQMPLPDNTAPMMTGDGPFGSVEMGGMFSVVKVRRGQARGDYRDPGWYRHPAGTQACEWTGALAQPPRAQPAASAPTGQPEVEVQVRKPSGHAHH